MKYSFSDPGRTEEPSFFFLFFSKYNYSLHKKLLMFNSTCKNPDFTPKASRF